MKLEDVIPKIKPSIPMIFKVNSGVVLGTGSGFVFQDYGIVVTCAHVVSGNNVDIMLRFPDNNLMIKADIVLIDDEHDIALLKYDDNGKNRPPLCQYKGEVLEGMPIIFAGYPLGIDSLTTHQGIISSIGVDASGMSRYSIDGSVNPGNSGGALMTAEGKVIGLVNAMRQENADILRQVREIPSGGIVSFFGLDIMQVLNSIINNLQLGIGYAVPAFYIPIRTKTPKQQSRKNKQTNKKEFKEEDK